MYWGLYQLLTVIATVATLAVFVRRQSVVPLGLFAGGAWSVVALQARNIEVYQQGQRIVVGSVAWQYLAVGLAVLSLAAAFLYFLGVFPPEDDVSRPTEDVGDVDPDTRV
jgi:fatty acid desaturase